MENYRTHRYASTHQNNESPTDVLIGFIFSLAFIALAIYIVVKFYRWFWKVNQTVQQMQLLKQESAKTNILIDKITAQFKLLNENLYREREEFMELKRQYGPPLS